MGEFGTASIQDENLFKAVVSGEGGTTAPVYSVGVLSASRNYIERWQTFYKNSNGPGVDYAEAYIEVTPPADTLAVGDTLNIITYGHQPSLYDNGSSIYLDPNNLTTYGGKTSIFTVEILQEGTVIYSEVKSGESSGQYGFLQRSHKFNIAYNNSTGSDLTGIKVRLKVRIFYNGDGITSSHKFTNILVSVSQARVNLTKDQFLLYVNEENYLQWTKDSLQIFGAALNVGDASLGNTVVDGDLQVLGNTVITGTVFGHPPVASGASFTLSLPNVVTGLTYDGYGHVTGHAYNNLDERYFTKTQVTNDYFKLTEGSAGAADYNNIIKNGITRHTHDNINKIAAPNSP